MANVTADREQLEDLLTDLRELSKRLSCKEGTDKAPCIEVPTSGKGLAVYYGDGTICSSDILLPGFNLLPSWLLAVAYLVFLIYIFFGIALASDAFMEGILAITSTTRRVKRKNEKGEVYYERVPVWNWVVANISLISVGASMPEIAMTMVEAVMTLGKAAGDLGPGTICGSAAFNSTIIPAVCMVALPAGVYKKITDFKVFSTVIIWSIWAYIWMLIVYLWWTPDQVTIAEAWITLAFFFGVNYNAWAVDNQIWKKWTWFKRCNAISPAVSPVAVTPAADPEAGAVKALPDASNGERPSSTADLDDADADPAVARNRAYLAHVMESRRRLGLRWRLRSSMRPPQQSWLPSGDEEVQGMTVTVVPTGQQQVMFRSAAYSFLESAKVARVAVIRVPAIGATLEQPIRVLWKTEDGDALSGLDYTAAEGILEFGPGETTKHIEVPLLDDNYSEPDVYFLVKLLGVIDSDDAGAVIVQDTVRVNIVDDDDAGMIGFQLPEYEVGYNSAQLYVDLDVVRRRGADGDVGVEYEIHSESALQGKDYAHPATGIINFDNGQKTARLRIVLLPGSIADVRKSLRLSLKNPTGGAELSTRHTARVTLVNTHNFSAKDGLELTVPASSDGKPMAMAAAAPAPPFNIKEAWLQQIKNAFELAPDADDPGAPRGWWTLVIFYINFTWRVVLGIMAPPPEWLGGYPCFIGALLSIIGFAYLMNEAGLMFGCIVGLKDTITGLTLLTLGTSVPDTFASYTFAVQNPDADAAIANAFNSNSINVYFGLALPWILCSAYYYSKGQVYATPRGDLAFAVMLFAVIGTLAVIILIICRAHGGELGGSKLRQWSVSLVLFLLWFAFIIASSLPAYGYYSNQL